MDLLGAMERQNRQTIDEKYKCSCENSFTFFDGIINDYCTDKIFSLLHFISDICESGECSIIVGTPLIIKLKKPIPVIHKVLLSNHDKFFESTPIYDDGWSELKIVTSETTSVIDIDYNEMDYAKIGEEVKTTWSIFGRTNDFQIDTWKQLLVQAREEFFNKKYILSFLSSAIALESYLNSKILGHLKYKQVDEKSIDIFLKESTMQDKGFTLFKSMLNIEPDNYGLSREKFKTIIEKRNKIAHGTIIPMDKAEAQNTFRAIITFIMKIEYEKDKEEIKQDIINATRIRLKRNVAT